MYMTITKKGVFLMVCLLITLNGFTQTVNSPSATSYPQSTNNQAVSGFSLSGFNTSATLLVTIGLVNPPSGATLRLGYTSGISASTGYTLSSNFTRISFTGTQANINTVLSSLMVNTGSVPGNVYIAVTATVNPAGYFYFPPNGHFYRPITSSGITYTNAKTGAAAETFKGQQGYLVTINSQDEQNFINTNVPLNNIWIALTDAALEGRWRIDAGPENGTLVWTASANVNNSTTNCYSSAGTTAPGQYVAWAPNEPNNDDAARGGEDHGVTKFNGNNTWNDLNNTNSSAVGGYVIEFGTWSDPADQTFTDFSTGFVTHQIGCTPANDPAVPTAPSGASWLSIGSNGLENGQSFANVIVYDDLYKVLPYPGSGTVINKEMSAAKTPNDTSNIVITFIKDGVVPSGGTIRFFHASNYQEESILLMKGHLKKADDSCIPRTGNELLDQYYMVGMKLFCQGPFAENVGKNEDHLGVFL